MAAAEASHPAATVGLPPHKPGRRRGLPRTEAEARARKAAAGKPAAAPTSAPEAKPGLKPGRRTGLSSTPAPASATKSPPAGRRTGLGGTPAPQPAPAPPEQPKQSNTEEPVPEKLASGTPAPAETKQGAGSSVTPAAEPTREPVRAFAGRTPTQWAVLAAAAVGVVVVLAAVLVLGSRWLLGTQAGTSFLADYPGQYAQPGAPSGYPWWLNWAHFFNMFLMVLVIKTGIQIRGETRPAAYWTPRWNPKRKISLTIWTHQVLDLLWVLNGIIFVVLLIATGYWRRVVPTSWDVFPNAISAGLQYASLDWPTTGDWAHYNSLQELAYFTTIFIAAPLAIATGIRMSGLWPANNHTLNKAFPLELARAVHFPVMIYFVVFIAVHVILVFATGALRNLNQIYTGQDVTNWTGFWLFTLSLAVIIAAVFATRAVIIAPIAALFGKVGR